MEPKATAIGNIYANDLESDIVELAIGVSGLRILVSTAFVKPCLRCCVEYIFPYHAGFRLLDEGDIFSCWSNENFQTGHHLYEIIENGWIEQETMHDGMLAVSGIAVRHKEFFIVTTNQCVNILSQNVPLIREYKK